MFLLSWKISVGKYALGLIESVTVTRSVEQLADTAEIVLPAVAFNRPLEVTGKIKRGDTVKIELGYDDRLVTEFTGYVSEEPSTDNGSLTIKCEDPIFLYRKSIDDRVLKNASIGDVVKYVNSQIGEGFTYNSSYDFSYDKFVISNATGYDVLKKLQEEAKPNIYLKEKVLQIHPQYIEIFGNSEYDFSKNIESADLKYRRQEDRIYQVVVEGRDAAGKVIKVEHGTTGGDKINIKISGVTDKNSLLKLAKEALATKSYTGYEGTFTGWLEPYTDAGYRVKIVDKDYEYKTGSYYVLEVVTSFSKDGGKRSIKLGKVLSDE